MMKVRSVFFRSGTASWETLFGQAAEFAAGIPREDLINISHSEDENEGVVAVWFWSKTDSDEPLAREGD